MTVIWGPFDWEIWIKFLNIRNLDIQICNKTRKRKTDFTPEKCVFGFSFFLFVCFFGSIKKVSGKLPTYPSPKPSFCPKREVSVNVSLGEW